MRFTATDKESGTTTNSLTLNYCMYIAYYQEDQNLKARYVAPEDGESDVYEILLAIVDDFKSQAE